MNLLQYATVVTDDLIDLNDINFGDGFGERVAYARITIKSNDDIKVQMKSTGFYDANNVRNDKLTSLVDYYYPGKKVSGISFGAGGNKSADFKWKPEAEDPGVFQMKLEARFLPTTKDQKVAEETWHQIRSGEYTDVVTVTISAAK